MLDTLCFRTNSVKAPNRTQNIHAIIRKITHRLHLCQNAAAQLVTSVKYCDHITSTLQQLHWLPAWQRVLFNIAVLVFQCLASQAPSYLADDCQLVSEARQRQLHSSDSLACAARCTWNTYGDCFAAAGTRVWNFLPATLWQCDSLKQFNRCLKTIFFTYGTKALCDYC